MPILQERQRERRVEAGVRKEQTIRTFVRWVSNHHCDGLHNADFEVCRVWLCRLAYRVERRFSQRWYKAEMPEVPR